MPKNISACLIMLGISGWLPAQPVIGEFMADNATTLKDGFGEYSDWVEIHNPGPAAVEMQGWHLTDRADDPGKFTFPQLTLARGARVVVFCSGRTGSTGAVTVSDPLGYLHTNFSLSRSGEYLGLVAPDGVIRASEFAPAFPAQITDVSYGNNGAVQSLIPAGNPVRFLAPTNGTADIAIPSWREPDFNDSSWTEAAGPGIGFEAGAPAAHWPLDDVAGSATADDTSGFSRDAAAFGSATFGHAGATPTSGSVAGFSGPLGRLSVTYDPGLNPPQFTFAAWVFPVASTGTHQSIITSRVGPANQQEGFMLYITPENQWNFVVGHNAGGSGNWYGVGGGSVTYGAWTHVAISRDSTGRNRIHINGVRINAANSPFTPNHLNPLHLGAGDDNGESFRFNGFIDDATFWSDHIGTELIGQHKLQGGASFPTAAYGGHYQTNVQVAMAAANPGIYTRHAFSIADPAAVNSLSLRIKFDDAFVAYLNGTEVARRNLTGVRSYDSTADTDRGDSEATVWEPIDLGAAGLTALREGNNILAIHGTRRTLSHPDFLLTPALDAEVDASAAVGYFIAATPGTPNAAIMIPGPLITEVAHSPAQPAANEDLTVTVRVTPRLNPVAGVELVWRVMYGPESAPLAMMDQGPAPGATDGSRLFSATIPASGGATARQMLRYYIKSFDTTNRVWRSPLVVDTSNDDGNSQSPVYHGTVVRDDSLVAGPPVIQWFTADVPNTDTRTGSRASVWYENRFYDNIHVRQRGGYTAGGSQKFDFNKGNNVIVSALPAPVGEFNLNSAGLDATHFRPCLAYDTYRQAGHQAPAAFNLAMYRNGSFQRMGILIEQIDEDFLDRYDLDRAGALYKFVQRFDHPQNNDFSNFPAFIDTLQGIEKKTRLHESWDDLNAVVAAVNQTDPEARRKWLFANLNLPNFVNFMALRSITAEIDMNRKNFYFYRDSEGSGEWYLFPWDKDMTMGIGYDLQGTGNPWQATNTYKHDPTFTRQWNVLWDAALNCPETKRMVGRRLRTLMDGVLGAPGTPANASLIEQRLEMIRAGMLPLPPGVATPSGYGSRTSWDTWLGQHRTALFGTYGPASGYDMIPSQAVVAPTVEITGSDANPTAASAGYSPQDHESIVLTNNGTDEVDLSGWTLWNPGASTPFMTFAAGTVIPGTASAPLNQLHVARRLAGFRNRPGALADAEFVVGPYDGQLSARGETVELRDGPLAGSRLVGTFATPSSPTAAQQFLRITELMFAPTAPTAAELLAAPGTTARDFEFIELQNTGSSTLDLTGAKFTDGVEFTFPALSLAPGLRILLVANAAAFAARYGSEPSVAGTYAGALDNSGDRLRIEDGTGEVILDFRYDELWFPPADGGGCSLVVRHPQPDYATYDLPTHWALSGAAGGTPGAADNGDLAHHYDGWLRDYFAESQIYLPEPAHPAATRNITLVGPEADPDGDGLNNFTEYAFGCNPRMPDHHSLTKAEIVEEAGQKCLAVTFTRPHKALDLVYTAEASNDLQPPWTPTGQQHGPAADLGGGLERITFRDTELETTSARFIRIRVSKP